MDVNDKIVSGFQLYRYYNFPDGSGREGNSHLCRSPMVSVTMTAPYTFSYTDRNLSSLYRVCYIRFRPRNNNKAEQHGTQISSEPLTCRTRHSQRIPDISVTIDGQRKIKRFLPIYPDPPLLATATDKYNETQSKIRMDGEVTRAVSYQGEAERAGSLDQYRRQPHPNPRSDTLSIENGRFLPTRALYRCRLNVLIYD